MLEQQIQNNNTDNFGLLPWDYEPGFIARLFGCKPFSIDNENILFNFNDSEIKLGYEMIDSIECDGDKIHIKDSSNNDYYLKVKKIAQGVCDILLRLSKELNEYKSFMNVDKIVPELGFAYFQKAFNYRGNPYVRSVEILLKTAVDNEFTDIHFEPTDNKVKVSYRLKGKLKYCIELSKDKYEHFIARAKYLASCNNQITNQAQEGSFRFNNSDIRLSTFPTDFGERASFRMIGGIKFSSVKALGWPEDKVKEWLNLVANKTGLFIITGSVGSGKTTAMYATLSDLVSNSSGQLRAVTIEDPVEAFISGICQSSFNPKSEKDLSSAFKHLLRQDPDIIALGEIRDAECIVEALQAGLSGHLVFATFHAGNPTEAIDRIKMMAKGNELILEGLKGILHVELTYKDDYVEQTPQIKELKKMVLNE